MSGEVYRDCSADSGVEASDDVNIWLCTGVCTVIGSASEAGLLFEFMVHRGSGSGSLVVPEVVGLCRSRFDPV